MKIYTLIYQKPLRVKTYSSLVALFEDNTVEQLGVSKYKLDRFDFDSTYYLCKYKSYYYTFGSFIIG